MSKKSSKKSIQSPNSPKSIFLSACLIVKDEQQQLPKCLQSLKSFADEIIVVDTGSSDRTIAIAKKHQAKIFHFDWCDDFSQARNYAIAQATGQWILVIDADEVLQPQAIAILKAVMQREDCLAANLLRHEVGASQAPYSLVLRLFRNHPAITFTGIYHESIDQSLLKLQAQEPQWQIVNVEVPVLDHYGYTAGAIANKDKLNFAESMMQKHLQRFPDDGYMLNKLGALYLSLAQATHSPEVDSLSKGIELLKQAISLTNIETNTESQKLSIHQNLLRCELFYHLGLGHSIGGNWELAKQAYEQAIALEVPELVKLASYMNLGNLWHEELIQPQPDSPQNLNQAAQAIAYFEKVTQIAPTLPQGFNNLGLAYKKSDGYPEAIACYQQAIAINPQYADAHQNLGAVFLKVGAFREAIAHLHHALRLHQQQRNYEQAQLLRATLREFGEIN